MYSFIINPAAGRGDMEKLQQSIACRMQEMQLEYEFLHTSCPREATRLARIAAAKDGCEAVIAVGGDGTICEVACGLMESDVPLGIIPMGTGNDFIKAVGIPKKPMEALEFILSHTPRCVDMGRLNDGCFLNDCGTGFDVTVLDCTVEAKKHLKGLLPYLIGLIRGIFRYKPVHVRYVADGNEHEKDVLVCSVANGRFIGGGIPICPDAKPDDGMLDLVVVDHRPRWMIPFYVPGLLFGRVLKFGITRHVRCKEVHVYSDNMRLNVDGEIRTMDEAHFSIVPEKLRLFW